MVKDFNDFDITENATMMVDWISPGLFFIFFICCPVF